MANNNFIGMLKHMAQQNRAKRRGPGPISNRKRSLGGPPRQPRKRGPVRPTTPINPTPDFEPRYDGFGPPPWGTGAGPEGFGPTPEGFGPSPEGFGPRPEGFGPPPEGFGPRPEGFGPPPEGFGPRPAGYGPHPEGVIPPPDLFGPRPEPRRLEPRELDDEFEGRSFRP